MDVRTAGPVVYSLQVQLIFTLKHRRGVFTQELLDRCEQVIGAICRIYGSELREFHGSADHVRLVVHHPPTVAISRLANNIQVISARRLRQEFPEHNLWSPSYFAATCGEPLATMAEYVEQHRRQRPP
ncbi:IS200/IS605 family transposase [Mycobacteroides abscessus]|uniref:IS200/IS605 family transposase n=1 Tax=Mycobacteroides abscessus TaxID=36809 RepID=UPI00266FEBB5|nr:IS200/IS605 family transposase [Mycobacteroides abscessus]MDO3110854.1 IS200/IS605 family transposase [Mycobacteroides abscessus subsp. abscessus]